MKNDKRMSGDDEAGAAVQPAFLGYEAVVAVIGVAVSKKTLGRWERDGLFPKRVRLSGKIIAWSAPDIKDWCEAQREGRPYVTGGP